MFSQDQLVQTVVLVLLLPRGPAVRQHGQHEQLQPEDDQHPGVLLQHGAGRAVQQAPPGQFVAGESLHGQVQCGHDCGPEILVGRGG